MFTQKWLYRSMIAVVFSSLLLSALQSPSRALSGVSLSLYPTTGDPGQTVTLSTRVYSGGAPLAGRLVQFSVDGNPAGTGTSDATGASCAYHIPGALSPGLHNVTVSFAGDGAYARSSRTAAALCVRAGVAFSLYAVSGLPGDTVMLRTLVYSGGAPASGLTVQFAVDGVAVRKAVSDGSDAAVAWVIPASLAAGKHDVTVSFAGSAGYRPASRTAAALRVKGRVAFSLRPASGSPGDTVTMRTLVYSGGGPVSGLTIQFSIDGMAFRKVVSDASGAGFTWPVPAALAPGTHDVTVSFAGSADYAPASRTTPALTVGPARKGVSFSIYPVYEHTAGFAATLKTLVYSGGLPVSGLTVWFAVDGVRQGSAVSTSSGAELAWRIPVGMGTGLHDITVSCDETADYSASLRTAAALTVTNPAYTGFSMAGVTGHRLGSVDLKCILDSYGLGLSGLRVDFAIDGGYVGSAVTDWWGKASISYTIPATEALGSHTWSAIYDPGPDPIYLGASGSAPLTVVTTALVLQHVFAAPGETATLGCELTCGVSPVAGKTVTFAVDGATAGSATTDSGGTATLSYPVPVTMAVGSHTVSASYAGAADYEPAFATGEMLDVWPDGLADTPWPKFHADAQNTGRGAGSGATGVLKWAFKTGYKIYSSPTIGSDGTIYVGSYDRNVYAINPDGTQNWAYDTANWVDSSPAVGADGSVFVGSENHNLYAISPSGAQRWAFKTGANIVASPAIGSDGTIYVGSTDCYLYAINRDGTQKWAFGTGGWVSDAAIGSDGTIYIGSRDDYHLYAIKPDGTQKWALNTSGWTSDPAVGPDGTIYVGSTNDYSFGDYLYAVDPNGSTKWWFQTRDELDACPAVGTDGTIYVGCANRYVYALNPGDGSVKWQFLTGGAVRSSAAIASDGTIYVGSDDGYLYAINPDGTQAWAFKTGGGVRSSPAIGVDGTVYFGSTDGYLYAIK